ncbi:TPA: hypothetical protein ACJW38_002172 [Salmonella enterica subsp. enterica serovar Thompson]
MDIGLLITSLKSGLGALSAVQSNEVLRERIAFIGEQIDVLQKAHAAAEQKLAEAEAKNIELTKQIEAYRAKEQFVEHMGAAFRKTPLVATSTRFIVPTVINKSGVGLMIFRTIVAPVVGRLRIPTQTDH